MTIIQIIALAFLIVSFVMAIIYQPNLQSPLLWAVWAIAIIIVLGGIEQLGHRVL